MSSIDFRTVSFNDRIDKLCKSLRLLIYKQNSWAQLKSKLESIKSELILFNPSTNYTEGSSSARGTPSVIFSQYLQQLFYLVPHFDKKNEPNNTSYAINILSKILQDYSLELFFKQEDNITLWIDPKEGDTALDSLVRLGDVQLLKNLLCLLEQAYGSKTDPRFQMVFNHTNKFRKNILNSAVYANQTAAALFLLEEAKEVFANIYSTDYRKFISHSKCDNLNSLLLAVYRGNQELVDELLRKATLAFQGRNTIGFQNFITHKADNGNTALHLACKVGKLNIVESLLTALNDAYITEPDKLIAILKTVTINGDTILNVAAIYGHHWVVAKLCDYVESLPHDLFNFKDFINQANNKGLTPLHNTLYKAQDCVCPIEEFEYNKCGLYLIICGADLEKRNNKGLEPIAYLPSWWKEEQAWQWLAGHKILSLNAPAGLNTEEQLDSSSASKHARKRKIDSLSAFFPSAKRIKIITKLTKSDITVSVKATYSNKTP